MHCVRHHVRSPVQAAKKMDRMSDRTHIKESLARVSVDSEDMSITSDWCEQNAILLVSHAHRQKDRQRTPESVKLCQDDSVGLLSLNSQPLAERLRHSDKFGLHNKMKRHPLQILSLLPASSRVHAGSSFCPSFCLIRSSPPPQLVIHHS